MDWSEQVNAYCERMGPGLWSEPANAVTNVAFMAAALWLWPNASGIERVLCAILFAIGIGSGLFHTYATRWAALTDTLPILLYILTYIYAANRRFWGWPVWAAALGVLAFFPYATATGWIFDRLPGFAVSSFYWPVPLLIAAYGVLLRHRLPGVSSGLLVGAGVLCLSLLARSLDMALCDWWPVGTHFAWHLLNAAMLGWMITVLRRHRLEPAGTGG